MKALKILCLMMALFMVGGALIACGGSGDGGSVETDLVTEVKRDPVNVNIIVRESVDGEDKYVSGDNGYNYEGDVLTVQEILIEFMDFEYGEDVVVDDNGKLVKVGEFEASDSQFWLFSIAKHPKGADQATPVDANIDVYGDIENGDTIVIYLS